MTERKRGRPPGPRIRSIKPEMPQDERIAKLSIPAELLFVRLISMADDEGRFRAAVNGIIGFAFPDREDVTQAKVRRWLREIEAQELILIYEFDGGRYGVVRNFGRHQSIQKATWSRLPEPPDYEIVAANIPEALRDDANSSRTNTGEIREPVQDHSDPPRAGAHAGAPAPIQDPSSSSSSSTTTDNRQRGAHGRVDQTVPPRELPTNIADRLDPVLALLKAVQEERGGALPTVRGVGLALATFPGRDHVAVARDLQHWATAGRGQRKPVRDWVRTYRTFLDGSEDAAPPRSGGPMPNGSRPGGPSVDDLIAQVQQRGGQHGDVIEGERSRMTPAEINDLVASMMRKWPQAAQRLAAESVAADYAEHLASVSPDHAHAAVGAWARDGQQWPPSAGEILQTLARLLLDPPDWGHVKAALTGQAPVPAGAPELPDECPYGECEGHGLILDWASNTSTPCRCRQERQAIRRQRRTRHPLVALFLAEVGALEVVDLLEDRTAEAQCREKWLAFLRNVNREVAYHGLDPAGLPQLERVTTAPTLRSGLGAAHGPQQLDPATMARDAIGGTA